MENADTLVAHTKNSVYIFIHFRKILPTLCCCSYLMTPKQFFNRKTIEQAFVVFTLGMKMHFSFYEAREGFLLACIICL